MPTTDTITTTQAAFQKAEIRLTHIASLISLASDEVRNTPVIVGDAELRNVRRLLREAATITADLKLKAQDES